MKIMALHVPRHEGFVDVVTWKPASDWCFSLKPAYNTIADTSPHSLNQLFKVIWKWKGPQRVKAFLWLVAQNAILTNERRCARHIAQHSVCRICGNMVETTLHALRDCDRVANI